jgi:hypothetical protein
MMKFYKVSVLVIRDMCGEERDVVERKHTLEHLVLEKLRKSASLAFAIRE